MGYADVHVPSVSEHDFDWIVVGSGFGGSVSALRLTEKGYRVGVFESGRRFADHEFPKSTWDLRRYFFAPRIWRGERSRSSARDVREAACQLARAQQEGATRRSHPT